MEFPIDGLARVPGFLTPQAAWLLHRLSGEQRRAGITGGVAEIGVFYGRSALVLGAGLGPGERLVACDTFAIGADGVPGWSFPPSGDPEEHLRRRWAEWIGPPGRLHVLRRDSADVTPADLGAPCRLVHVDGGHAYDVVLRDAVLADEALGDGGAIVFDDVLLPEWPDVTVAIVDHLRARGERLVPVLVAEHKLVVCRPAHATSYRAWARTVARELYPPPRHLVAGRAFVGAEVAVVSRLPG